MRRSTVTGSDSVGWKCLVLAGMLAFVQSMAAAQPAPDNIPSYPVRNARDLSPLLQEMGNAHIVLLGESSHGTAEFYRWRDSITRRLITEKGFRLVAIEGEWADTWHLTGALRGGGGDSTAVHRELSRFNRWPAAA